MLAEALEVSPFVQLRVNPGADPYGFDFNYSTKTHGHRLLNERHDRVQVASETGLAKEILENFRCAVMPSYQRQDFCRFVLSCPRCDL
jgi:hypothetical protein